MIAQPHDITKLLQRIINLQKAMVSKETFAKNVFTSFITRIKVLNRLRSLNKLVSMCISMIEEGNFVVNLDVYETSQSLLLEIKQLEGTDFYTLNTHKARLLLKELVRNAYQLEKVSRVKYFVDKRLNTPALIQL